MKILHCLKYFLPTQVAGTEIYVAGLCRELQHLGIEAIVVNPSFGITPKEYFYNEITVKQYFEPSFASSALQLGIKAPEGLNNFKELLIREKPDAVHFHEMAGSNGITIFHLMAAKELGFPVFTTFHLAGNICMRNSFLFKGKTACNGIIDTYKCSVCMLQKKNLYFGIPELASLLGQRFKKKISLNGAGKLFNYPLYVKQHAYNLKTVNNISEKMFVLSNWYKALLISNGLEDNKIIVLPPAIAEPVLTTTLIAKNKIIDQNKMRFVYAGRVTEIKGLHILLAALLSLRHQNWILDIYGDISETEYHNSCVKKIASNSAIRWKGILEHNKIISTLRTYDVLIFPSIVQETMGLILLEAFAAGIPVIASSLWSVKEKIQHGINGLIFNKNDSMSLKETLEIVLDNPSLINAMAENIKAPFNMTEVAKITSAAYSRSMISKTRG